MIVFVFVVFVFIGWMVRVIGGEVFNYCDRDLCFGFLGCGIGRLF